MKERKRVYRLAKSLRETRFSRRAKNLVSNLSYAVWAFVALALLAIFFTAAPALAQQPTQDEINQVAKKLSCPTCTGINVADCPTETCAQWRAQIGEMLVEGSSEQEILDYFSARYGDHVLQVPPKRGFFMWVWILPVLAILAGLAWLAYLMRTWLGRRAIPAETVGRVDAVDASAAGREDAAPDDEYLRRVQQDLERLS
jgi:cytochrome c-type biogenesis protein CcmH